MADTENLTPEEEAENAAEHKRLGELPAVYVDTFASYITSTFMRLAFGENLRDKTYYRTAILLELEDAIALRDFLTERIARMEEKAREKAEKAVEKEVPKDG